METWEGQPVTGFGYQSRDPKVHFFFNAINALFSTYFDSVFESQ